MCNYVESKGVLHSVFSLPEIGCPWIGVHLKVRKSSLCFFFADWQFIDSGFFWLHDEQLNTSGEISAFLGRGWSTAILRFALWGKFQ